MKDKLGNKLEVGDLVEVVVPDHIMGRVLEIQEPSRVGGVRLGKLTHTAGQVKVIFDFDAIAINPRVPDELDAVLKIVDPNPPDVVAQMMRGQAEMITGSIKSKKLITN